jgi:hypothetical protein
MPVSKLLLENRQESREFFAMKKSGQIWKTPGHGTCRTCQYYDKEPGMRMGKCKRVARLVEWGEECKQIYVFDTKGPGDTCEKYIRR